MSHITLSELNEQIGKVLNQNLQPTYWVVAEIGEMRVHPKGHCYLEFIEKDGEQIAAKIKGTIWSYTYQELLPWFRKITGNDLREGMKILFNAEVQYHPTYGLTLNVRDIDASFTLGEREKIKREVLLKLEEEGHIHLNRERTLPLAPQRIAIISSEHSAGYEDFKEQLSASPYAFSMKLFPADIQGAEANKSIVASFKRIFQEVDDFDLVVLLRGGGAQSDLDVFNAYLIGKAVARFPLPVVTGIGHDRDETVADLVARVSLKTPTAVAEFLIDGLRLFEQEISSHFDQIIRGAVKCFNMQERNLQSTVQNLRYSLSDYLNTTKQGLELFESRLLRLGNNQINHHRETLYQIENQILRADPQAIFDQGFTLTLYGGKRISNSNMPVKGDQIQTISKEMVMESLVNKIERS